MKTNKMRKTKKTMMRIVLTLIQTQTRMMKKTTKKTTTTKKMTMKKMTMMRKKMKKIKTLKKNAIQV